MLIQRHFNKQKTKLYFKLSINIVNCFYKLRISKKIRWKNFNQVKNYPHIKRNYKNVAKISKYLHQIF